MARVRPRIVAVGEVVGAPSALAPPSSYALSFCLVGHNHVHSMWQNENHALTPVCFLPRLPSREA